MDKESNTNKIPLLVILAFAVIGILAANICLEKAKLSGLSITTDRLIAADGVMYDLRDDKAGSKWLRQISPEGRLTAHILLQESAGSRYIYREIIDLVDGEIFLFEYECEGMDNTVRQQTVRAYDLQSGKDRTVYTETVSETILNDYYASDRIWDGGLFFGHVSGGVLQVKRLDIRTGRADVYWQAEFPFVLSYVHVLRDGAVIAASADSKIWRYNGVWELIFASEGLEAISNVSIGNDGAVYAYVTGDEGGHAWQKSEGTDTFSPILTLPLDTLTMEFCDKETWVAVRVDQESHTLAIEVSFGGVNSLAKLSVPLNLVLNSTVLLKTVLHSILMIVIILLAQHVYHRRKTRLIVKQILVAFPIFAAGLFLFYSAISERITEEMYRKTYDELLLHALEIAQDIDKERFSAIHWGEPFEDEYYLELRDRLGERSLGGKIPWQDSNYGISGEMTYYFNSWLFRVSDGEAYIAICDNAYVNLEAHYIDKGRRYQMVDLLLDQQRPTEGRTYGTAGDGYWLNSLYPVFDGAEMIGFIEVGKPTTAVDAAVNRIMTNIFMIVLLVMGVSLLAYITVLKIFLRAMEMLKRGAVEIAEGNYGARVQITTTDETADIAAAFNRMADSVEESGRHVRATRDAYSYFVPGEMLTILGKESIAQVGPGSYAHLRACYLLLSSDSFDALRDKTFFDALNRFYACVIPHISAAGGVIERYNGRGLAALFDSPPEILLNALIDLFAALDGQNDALRQEGLPAMDCQTMLILSDSLLGVIGNEKRLNMIAVSRLTYESERVGAMCRRYGCRLLLTQTVYDELGETISAYRHRLLGYISDGGQAVAVYDFYDAEMPKLMRGKAETQELFEQAVGHYYAGDYVAARRLFIEVIKCSPTDLAAREYLKDSHVHMESGLPPTPLLEI